MLKVLSSWMKENECLYTLCFIMWDFVGALLYKFSFVVPWYTCFLKLSNVFNTVLIFYMKKMNRVSLMLFFVDILISHQTPGLPYQLVPKIWSRRCYELTLKNGSQQLKCLVSQILLVNKKLICFMPQVVYVLFWSCWH